MIDIVITHRNSDSFRERNLNFILYYYRTMIPDSNIILVEQNSITNNESVKKYVNKHVAIITNEKLFCRSLCLNEGFRYRKFEYILFSDNDVCLDDNFLKNIKDYFIYDYLIPYNINYFLNLTEKQTLELIKDYQSFNRDRGDLMSRGHCGGGAFFIKADIYYNIGGYDPRFIGWGAEDSAFGAKIMRFHKIIRPEIKLLHLNHPTETNSMETNPHYSINYKYFKEYCNMTDQQTIDKINELGFEFLKS